jgi:hypothetical protein
MFVSKIGRPTQAFGDITQWIIGTVRVKLCSDGSVHIVCVTVPMSIVLILKLPTRLGHILQRTIHIVIPLFSLRHMHILPFYCLSLSARRSVA